MAPPMRVQERVLHVRWSYGAQQPAAAGCAMQLSFIIPQILSALLEERRAKGEQPAAGRSCCSPAQDVARTLLAPGPTTLAMRSIRAWNLRLS
jgi:hypothetical protein